MSFFNELKRRNVFKVGIAYVIVAWLVAQVLQLVFESFGTPDWAIKTLLVLLATGLPFALFFAWAFEMTPEGVKREAEIDRSQSITAQTGKNLNNSILLLMVLVIAYLLFDKFSSQEVDNIDTPVTESTVDSAQQATEPKAEQLISNQSIAVLPFADLSQAKDQEWFADGLAEEILNALAKTPDLLVSSRTSSFRYKDSPLDLPDIANELGVEHILEGSVRSSGKRIRVTAQLIRASDGFHVWSENYDRDVADMIEIQEDLALNIAKALETTMDPVALAAMVNTGTHSVEAYEAYLRGLALRQKSWTSSARGDLFRESYQHFETARSIDPGFASAHRLAAVFWKAQLTPSHLASGLTDLEPRQMLDEFNERVDDAIASAPTPEDKKVYMATKALVELRLNESIRLFGEYLKERPNDGLVRYDFYNAAGLKSDSELQLPILEYWHERGTSDMTDAFVYMNNAYQFVDPSQAADFGLQALRRWPNHNALMYQTHRTLMWAGRILEGKELADRYSRLYPENDTLVRARQACAEGRRVDVEAIYESLDPNSNYDVSYRWLILKLLGEERQATEVLMPYAISGVPYMLSSFLSYSSFDPGPFPEVLAVLDREGVNRSPTREIPFKCPPPD